MESPSPRAAGHLLTTTRRMGRLAGVMLTVVVLLMGLFSPLAHADTTTSSAGACSSTAAVGNQILPVFRWAESSGTLHSIPPVGVIEGAASIHLSMQRSLTGTVIGLGNSNYVLATSMVDMASSFCPLQQFGYLVDSTVKTVGDSIIGVGLLAALAVFAVVSFVLDRARGRGIPYSTLLKKALVLGLIFLMVQGASASKGGEGKPYEPGTLSPGWMMSNVDKATSWLANTVAGTIPVYGANADKYPANNDALSCEGYTTALHFSYQNLMKDWKMGDRVGPKMLNSMWESSGMMVFKSAQFGDNKYADIAFCRYLDYKSTTVGWTVSSGMQGYDNLAGQYPSIAYNVNRQLKAYGAPVFAPANSGTFKPLGSEGWVEDAAMTAFAACKLEKDGGWSIRNVNLLPHDKRNLDEARKACSDLFGQQVGDTSLENLKKFRWEGKAENISNNMVGTGPNGAISQDDLAAQNFLLVFQGHDTGGGLGLSITYIGGSLLALVALGGLALALLIAKLAAIVMGLGALFVAILSIIGNGNERRVLDFAKQYVGLSLFAAGYSFLLAVVAMLCNMIAKISLDVAGSGLVAMLITAGSPAIAFLLLRSAFKKMGLPNPMSITGGLKFATAARSLSADELGRDTGSTPSSGRAGALANKAGRKGKAYVANRFGLGAKPGSGTAADAALAGAKDLAGEAVKGAVVGASATAAGMAVKDHMDGKEAEGRRKDEAAGEGAEVGAGATPELEETTTGARRAAQAAPESVRGNAEPGDTSNRGWTKGIPNADWDAMTDQERAQVQATNDQLTQAAEHRTGAEWLRHRAGQITQGVGNATKAVGKGIWNNKGKLALVGVTALTGGVAAVGLGAFGAAGVWAARKHWQASVDKSEAERREMQQAALAQREQVQAQAQMRQQQEGATAAAAAAQQEAAEVESDPSSDMRKDGDAREAVGPVTPPVPAVPPHWMPDEIKARRERNTDQPSVPTNAAVRPATSNRAPASASAATPTEPDNWSLDDDPDRGWGLELDEPTEEIRLSQQRDPMNRNAGTDQNRGKP